MPSEQRPEVWDDSLYNVAVKVVVTPLLIGAASMAGRRWGHHVGGWLVALPLTSGPVAFFLATDHGPHFAGRAAVGMMAGTISQVVFALAYRRLADRGRAIAFASGCAGFTASTLALTSIAWTAAPTFALTTAAVTIGLVLTRRHRQRSSTDPGRPDRGHPRWDIPARMAAATTVVLAITALAPVVGPFAAGLLSPFPVFGAVVAVMAHHVDGAHAATATLEGLITGLATPAVFFLTLALTLPHVGLSGFILATLTALATQALTMLVTPTRPDMQPAS